jgi:uncharacterized protein YutE (UPF0331/DUF86 family)
MINADKLRDKIQRIKDNLVLLETIRSVSYTQFCESPLYSPAATRMLQVSIEAMIDIGNHVVAKNHLGTPKTYRETFELLTKNQILPKKDLELFLTMVKFRNRAVHLYDKISDEEIYNIIQNHLPDFEHFIACIVNAFFSER